MPQLLSCNCKHGGGQSYHVYSYIERACSRLQFVHGKISCPQQRSCVNTEKIDRNGAFSAVAASMSMGSMHVACKLGYHVYSFLFLDLCSRQVF